MTMTFKGAQQRETPTRLVTITAVNMNNLLASGLDVSNSCTLTIDLSVFTPPVIQYPTIGEVWYVILLQQRWVLSQKEKTASNGYLNHNASSGDQVWDVVGNLVQTVKGTFSLADSHGTLTTHSVDPWHNFTLLNSWITIAGYCAPGYRMLTFGESVILRGTAVSGTINTVLAALPTGYYPAGVGFMRFPCISPPAPGTVPVVTLDNTNGNLQLNNQAAGASISIDGIVISLV